MGGMPLFMDRHDLQEVTAEQVAQAHMADLSVQAKHGVQMLTYWFDAARQTAFCLANAARPEDLQSLHAEAHGLIPNEIISVSEGDVMRFLGNVATAADAPGRSAFRSILFTDVEGSTALLDRIGQAAYMDVLAEHDRIIRGALASWHGREVKHTGDGFLASFEKVEDALRCAIAIQDAFRARGDEREHPVRVRIGIAAGEPVDHDGDIFGAAVNLASRITDAAAPGQILVSDVVRDLAPAQFSFRDIGPLRLKGFAQAVHAFEVATL